MRQGAGVRWDHSVVLLCVPVLEEMVSRSARVFGMYFLVHASRLGLALTFVGLRLVPVKKLREYTEGITPV